MAVTRRLFSADVRTETSEMGRSLLARFGSQFVLDAVAWVVAVVVAVVFRYDFDAELIAWLPLIGLVVVLIAAQLLLGWVFGLYRGRFTYGSFEEVRGLLYAVFVTALVAGIPIVIIGTAVRIPRSTVFIAVPIAFVLMGAVRYIKRLYVDHRVTPRDGAQKTLLFGAGYMGQTLVRRMKTDHDSLYRPVGLLDDDRRKKNLQIMGVPVLGDFNNLERAVERTGATTLVVSIARVDAELLRTINDDASALGLAVKVLPPLSDVLEGHSGLADVRDIAIEDLIGRRPVDTDVQSIAGYITGKRVLVTGAGGSIGSELCRQISRFAPAELMMLDRDETGLQTAQISILGRGLLDTKDVVLADIRDADALNEIFTQRRPQVVFHAAALKHLPMLEQYPDEAWKTNVLGTLNVLEAARLADVHTFVNVSTDKAANPTSVLGHSKRVAEKLTAWVGQETGRRYLSVRFGNVIGSRGSMLPTFQTLIDAGGPLTVTHPDVTRFFMTIPEACQLVVQAGGIGDVGEVLILDMGEPVKILDVAERMIAASGKKIEIVFTGLRVGEKLHEELVGHDEPKSRPKHPKIMHANIPPMSSAQLDKAGWERRLHTHGAETEIIVLAPGAAEAGR